MKKFFTSLICLFFTGFLVLATLPAAMATMAPNNDLRSIAIETNTMMTGNDLVNFAHGALAVAGTEAVVMKEAVTSKIPFTTSSGFYFTDFDIMDTVTANCLRAEQTVLASEAFRLKTPSLAATYFIPIIMTKRLNKMGQNLNTATVITAGYVDQRLGQIQSLFSIN